MDDPTAPNDRNKPTNVTSHGADAAIPPPNSPQNESPDPPNQVKLHNVTLNTSNLPTEPGIKTFIEVKGVLEIIRTFTEKSVSNAKNLYSKTHPQSSQPPPNQPPKPPSKSYSGNLETRRSQSNLKDSKSPPAKVLDRRESSGDLFIDSLRDGYDTPQLERSRSFLRQISGQKIEPTSKTGGKTQTPQPTTSPSKPVAPKPVVSTSSSRSLRSNYKKPLPGPVRRKPAPAPLTLRSKSSSNQAPQKKTTLKVPPAKPSTLALRILSPRSSDGRKSPRTPRSVKASKETTAEEPSLSSSGKENVLSIVKPSSTPTTQQNQTALAARPLKAQAVVKPVFVKGMRRGQRADPKESDQAFDKLLHHMQRSTSLRVPIRKESFFKTTPLVRRVQSLPLQREFSAKFGREYSQTKIKEWLTARARRRSSVVDKPRPVKQSVKSTAVRRSTVLIKSPSREEISRRPSPERIEAAGLVIPSSDSEPVSPITPEPVALSRYVQYREKGLTVQEATDVIDGYASTPERIDSSAPARSPYTLAPKMKPAMKELLPKMNSDRNRDQWMPYSQLTSNLIWDSSISRSSSGPPLERSERGGGGVNDGDDSRHKKRRFSTGVCQRLMIMSSCCREKGSWLERGEGRGTGEESSSAWEEV